MYKKILCIALVVGVSLTGFAQEQAKPKSSEIRRAAIEQAVSQKHAELMGNMMKELNSTEIIKKSAVKFRKAGKEERYRFLFAGDVQEQFGVKKPTLKKVYRYLTVAKPQVTTEFSFEPNQISKQPSVTKGKFSSNTKGKVITTVKKGGNVIGETKYDVTLRWQGKVAKNKNTGNYDVKCIKLVSVYQDRNFDDDMLKMQKAIEELIQGYYDDLEANNWEAVFTPEIPDLAVVKPLLEKSIEVKRETNDFKYAAPDPHSETFTTSENEVPVIEIYVDPAPHFKDEAYFYPADAKAYHLCSLTFTIAFNKDFEGELTKVDYTHLGFNPPMLDKELKAAWQDKIRGAQDIANSFKDKIEVYVTSGSNAKSRDELAGMFIKNNGKVVEVSFLEKSGEEIIKTRTAKEYFTNLRGKKMSVNFDKKEFLNNDINTVVYTFLQKYTGRFTDCTDKKLYLKYDEKAGKYFIEKIEVVRGSTRKCEE